MTFIDSSTRRAEFPTISVCPDYHVAYKSEVLEKYGVTKRDMRRYIYPETKNMSSTTFLMQATYNVTEIIKDIIIEQKDNRNDINLIFEKVNNQKDENTLTIKSDWFVAHDYHLLGTCYSFQIPSWIKKLKVCIL